MHTSKTNCKYCYSEFRVKHPDRDEAERLLMQKYVEHINSDEHKRKEKEWRGNQYTILKSSTVCQCGETISVQSSEYEFRVKDIDDDVRRRMDRWLFEELREHRDTAICKTKIMRNDKIKELIG